ncbi:hypothetical protein [Nocardiopsis coralli]|uniref:hypothetical protein n=1 Tax=Nocardiopsis coralli TaxID=2772213 RepID=UPI002E2A0CBE|nr:hypothetical protein [Nocardiopsis coralli]
MFLSLSRVFLTAPAALVGAAALALFPLAPAAADTASEDEPGFPASAVSTLVRVDLPDEDTRGFWGRVHAESELGAERSSAEFGSDPTGITPYLEVAGPQRSQVGTSAEDNGRAEAHTSAAGIELFPTAAEEDPLQPRSQEQQPLVAVSGLHTSVACDFHGNLSWEHGLGGSGFSEQVITVLGTPVPADEPEVTQTVEGPGGEDTEVTVTTTEPDGEDARGGTVGTTVTAVQDGEMLFELTLGQVSVECGTPDETADGGAGTAVPAGTGFAAGADQRSGGLPAADGAEAADDSAAGAVTADDRDGIGRDQSADGPPGPGTYREASAEGLPVTGTAVAGLGAVGVLALLSGGVALYLGRRRSAQGDDA